MATPPVSKITGGPVEPWFRARVLEKYDVQYYRCLDTGFIQTEEPYWLAEAYADHVNPLDVGYVGRNFGLWSFVASVISKCVRPDGKFLDYGGGYGMLVRLLRDNGYDFRRADPYCPNLFATYFDFDPTKSNGQRFELLTAFEVFEHMPEPTRDVGKLFDLTDTILFSTELLPRPDLRDPSEWYYFGPEHGQHIAFYTVPALQRLAERFDAVLHTNRANLHMLTRNRAVPNPFDGPLPPAPPRAGFLQSDFEYAKSRSREDRSAHRNAGK